MASNPIINFFLQVLTLRGTFNWNLVWNNIFTLTIFQGVVLTIILSVISQFLGTLIGLGLYFLRRSPVGPLRVLANGYIWIFRGTPLLVQILIFDQFFAYIQLNKPLNAIDPFTALGFPNFFMSAFIAAILALSLNEGAYMAEIVRAGIDSIDVGQLEAAKSLGMTYSLAMRRIVIPQALRVIVPPLGNEFNNMLKNSSLASAISVFELLQVSQSIASRTFGILELLLVASLWYLLMTTIWGFVQAAIERRINASNIDPSLRARGNWWQRAFGIGPRAGTHVPEAPVSAGVEGTGH